MQRTRSPRIALPLIVLAVAMVGCGAYTGFRALTTGDDEDGGTAAPAFERVASDELGEVATEPKFAPGPAAYRIRSLVRRPGAEDAEEVLTVSRPFTSRRVTTSSAGDVSVDETTFGRVATGRSSATAQVIAGAPVPPDDRVGAIAADAIAAGLLVAREERRVAGERCRVLRGGLDPDILEPPTEVDHVDRCVAADGLVLEEWRVEGGRPVGQRVATNVDRAPDDPARQELPLKPTLDVNTGGGFVRRADPSSAPPGEFFVLDAPPDGFTFDGRFTVIPAQTALSDPEQRDNVVASTADVYLRGTDVLVVERGATRGTVKAFEPHPHGRPVDLGELLGRGEALTTWRGNEVRVTRSGGRFVRISGTLETEELQRVARALRSTPGGDGLRYPG